MYLQPLTKTINLYKHLSITPKLSDSIHDVLTYCQNLEHMLRKLWEVWDKFSVSKAVYGKLEDQHEKMQGNLRKYEREHKEHVEEIELLQIKLEESEKREKKLIAEKNKAQKYNVEFQKRI